MSERRELYALTLSKLDGWRESHVADHGQMPEHYARADAVISLADEETKRRHDTARAFMGPETMPHESEGPAMFAKGWHAALKYLEENR